jgi:hypothetical protein
LTGTHLITANGYESTASFFYGVLYQQSMDILPICEQGTAIADEADLPLARYYQGCRAWVGRLLRKWC